MKRNEVIIPLVQQDASREETILQIAFALESVETYVKTVFKNIEAEIKVEKTRIQDIRNRCQIAKAKVEKITGIQKSIQVFSNPKYPVPPRNLFFKKFDHSFSVKEPDIQIERTPPDPERCSIKEKSKFYHVRDPVQLIKKNEELVCHEGLGPVPQNLKSISSLLLFNTDENLYKQYKIIDPLSSSSHLESLRKSEKSLDIEPPPASILSKEPFGLKQIPNYFYTPISQTVPDLQAPLDLPFLSGIAGDLRFEENTVEEVPRLEKNIETDSIEFFEEKVTLIEELPKVDSAPSVSDKDNVTPPPPPPPPPPPVSEELDTPDMLELKVTNHSAPSSTVPPTQISDMRANLMEAIREAGGKPKLKKYSEKTNKSSSKKPMSLMDDLHDKLMRRRKGISGKLENTEGNILDKVATMIPPPPVKEDESEEDDGDWDD